ncbi:hypothetical protein LJR235_003568 [Pararhizobium sp. LjRoot235]|uniref:hypothetical protein n=1 Tax=Pararhizobium sp. LjRoot235 TaxID=3342291 RepID=UPI003ECF3854
MIPIKLHWKRCVDGFERDAAKPDILHARSERTDPVTYELADLENPVVLHLMNCQADEDYIAFVSRFGPVMRMSNKTVLSVIRTMAENIKTRALFTIDKRAHRETGANFINRLVRDVSLRPSYVYSEASGRGRLVMQATSLSHFMAMEFIAIHEAGAVATTCEHCDRIFLTGPLTGRRSHAKYCSDRCRVAAMRARNAAKED